MKSEFAGLSKGDRVWLVDSPSNLKTISEVGAARVRYALTEDDIKKAWTFVERISLKGAHCSHGAFARIKMLKGRP